MNKWLSLVVAVISVDPVYAGEGAIKVASITDALALTQYRMALVMDKTTSCDSKKTSSPRCNDLKTIVPGQVLPHKLLVRAESELRFSTY